MASDILEATPFNAAFSLGGTTDVPEPASLVVLGLGLVSLGALRAAGSADWT